MKTKIGLFSFMAFCLAGCCTFPQRMVERASEMIRAGQAECILIQGEKIVAIEHGGSVSPLLEVYDKHRAEMEGGIIVDKVIGRAAATIAICGKVRHVHGEVMSEDAVTFLEDNEITSSYTLLVPRILNQKRDGLCPLEKSVEGIEQADHAMWALLQKISSFQKTTP